LFEAYVLASGTVATAVKEHQLISGLHRALLQSITFISRLNAFNYKKLRG